MKSDTVTIIPPYNTNDAARLIPFSGSLIPAGFPSPAMDYMEDKIDLNQLLIPHPSSTFLVRVEGNSMIDAFMPPGAILIIDRSLTPKSNHIVVACISGEFTVKRFVVNNEGTFLMPANKKFKALQITDQMEFIIWGVVAHVIINTKEI